MFTKRFLKLQLNESDQARNIKNIAEFLNGIYGDTSVYHDNKVPVNQKSIVAQLDVLKNKLEQWIKINQVTIDVPVSELFDYAKQLTEPASLETDYAKIMLDTGKKYLENLVYLLFHNQACSLDNKKQAISNLFTVGEYGSCAPGRVTAIEKANSIIALQEWTHFLVSAKSELLDQACQEHLKLFGSGKTNDGSHVHRSNYLYNLACPTLGLTGREDNHANSSNINISLITLFRSEDYLESSIFSIPMVIDFIANKKLDAMREHLNQLIKNKDSQSIISYVDGLKNDLNELYEDKEFALINSGIKFDYDDDTYEILSVTFDEKAVLFQLKASLVRRFIGAEYIDADTLPTIELPYNNNKATITLIPGNLSQSWVKYENSPQTLTLEKYFKKLTQAEIDEIHQKIVDEIISYSKNTTIDVVCDFIDYSGENLSLEDINALLDNISYIENQKPLFKQLSTALMKQCLIFLKSSKDIGYEQCLEIINRMTGDYGQNKTEVTFEFIEYCGEHLSFENITNILNEITVSEFNYTEKFFRALMKQFSSFLKNENLENDAVYKQCLNIINKISKNSKLDAVNVICDFIDYCGEHLPQAQVVKLYKKAIQYKEELNELAKMAQNLDILASSQKAQERCIRTMGRYGFGFLERQTNEKKTEEDNFNIFKSLYEELHPSLSSDEQVNDPVLMFIKLYIIPYSIESRNLKHFEITFQVYQKNLKDLKRNFWMHCFFLLMEAYKKNNFNVIDHIAIKFHEFFEFLREKKLAKLEDDEKNRIYNSLYKKYLQNFDCLLNYLAQQTPDLRTLVANKLIDIESFDLLALFKHELNKKKYVNTILLIAMKTNRFREIMLSEDANEPSESIIDIIINAEQSTELTIALLNILIKNDLNEQLPKGVINKLQSFFEKEENCKKLLEDFKLSEYNDESLKLFFKFLPSAAKTQILNMAVDEKCMAGVRAILDTPDRFIDFFKSKKGNSEKQFLLEAISSSNMFMEILLPEDANEPSESIIDIIINAEQSTELTIALLNILIKNNLNEQLPNEVINKLQSVFENEENCKKLLGDFKFSEHNDESLKLFLKFMPSAAKTLILNKAVDEKCMVGVRAILTAEEKNMPRETLDGIYKKLQLISSEVNDDLYKISKLEFFIKRQDLNNFSQFIEKEIKRVAKNKLLGSAEAKMTALVVLLSNVYKYVLTENMSLPNAITKSLNLNELTYSIGNPEEAQKILKNSKFVDQDGKPATKFIFKRKNNNNGSNKDTYLKDVLFVQRNPFAFFNNGSQTSTQKNIEEYIKRVDPRPNNSP